ncbi:MAG: hypothetical protein WA977_07025 [Halobacteriota archaeon]
MLVGTDPKNPSDYPGAPVSTLPATPTPEEPGFEAVFANFFASQKPLLKMLRYCRTVSSGVFSGAKKEEVKQAMQKTKNIKIFGGWFFYSPVIYF